LQEVFFLRSEYISEASSGETIATAARKIPMRTAMQTPKAIGRPITKRTECPIPAITARIPPLLPLPAEAAMVAKIIAPITIAADLSRGLRNSLFFIVFS
jgi:hypothetical protein